MSLGSRKAERTQSGIGTYTAAGEYGIPVLNPEHLDERIEWIRFNHALKEPHRESLGVHFFWMIILLKEHGMIPHAMLFSSPVQGCDEPGLLYVFGLSEGSAGL
jgi:hypothetical protein